MRGRDKAAEQYDGYQVARSTGRLRNSANVEWGIVQYHGAEARPQYFTAALLKRRHIAPSSSADAATAAFP